MQVDADKLWEAIRERWWAVSDAATEATHRASQAYQAMRQAQPDTDERADAQTAFDKALSEADKGHARSAGLADAIRLLDDMTKPCETTAANDAVAPADIRHQIGLASGSLSAGVGIALGMWTGQGDWASLTDAGRAKAGRRALEMLDRVLVELTTTRAALAAALDTED